MIGAGLEKKSELEIEDQSPRERKRERHSLLLLCLVLLCAVIKQLLIHFHKQLQGIVDQSMDCPVTKKRNVHEARAYP
jgi:hypothetical protein